MIRVVIIGSGGVAEALANAVTKSNDLQLKAICGRNAQRLSKLSQLHDCETVNLSSGIKKLPESDIYIISVSDSAIAEVVDRLDFTEGSVVVHTAGSVSVDVLQKIKNRGVIYPMQTFTPGRAVDFRQVPLFIEGECEVITKTAHALSDHVREMSSAERVDLHLAAVFACNFANAMFGAAADLLEKQGVVFEIYKPLIKNMVEKMIGSKHPLEVQTGPAIRGDQTTMNNHLEKLGNNQQLKEIYRCVSNYILDKKEYKNGKL